MGWLRSVWDWLTKPLPKPAPELPQVKPLKQSRRFTMTIATASGSTLMTVTSGEPAEITVRSED
jgi:hypothetical protein